MKIAILEITISNFIDYQTYLIIIIIKLFCRKLLIFVKKRKFKVIFLVLSIYWSFFIAATNDHNKKTCMHIQVLFLFELDTISNKCVKSRIIVIHVEYIFGKVKKISESSLKLWFCNKCLGK